MGKTADSINEVVIIYKDDNNEAQRVWAWAITEE